MEEINAELYGFDFRGPASSEALNQFLEKANSDLGSLLQSAYRVKNETLLLSEQTIKQTMAMSMVLQAMTDAERDSGSNCKADLTDASVLLTTDRNEESIPAADRLIHRQQFPVISPPVERLNWLARDGSTGNFVASGVNMDYEVVNETGTAYDIPLEFAIAGLNSLAYERILMSGTLPGSTQTTTIFFSIPETRTGTGYPNSNYITFLPFPIFTPSMRVWYTTDSEPDLSIAGSSWNDWSTYVTDLRHATVYKTHCGPLYTSFPTTNITAIRIDLQQPHYLVDGSNYVYSYGLGGLELGIVKTTSSTPMGTVRIDKPSGNFVSVDTDAADIVLANIPSAEADAVVSTYSWVDPGDSTIAYVEITLNPSAASGGQIPIIKEVSVDYT